MFITNVRGVGPTYYNKETVHFQIMISNNLKKNNRFFIEKILYNKELLLLLLLTNTFTRL